MIPVQQAEAIIWQSVVPFDPNQDGERVELWSGVGRVLAQTMTSPLDFPHWDNSAMDGYAVRFADVQGCTTEQPVSLEIVEEIPAGTQPQQAIQSGQAARILTGSMMPVGADTVVMQENTQRQGSEVKILKAPREWGEFVRRQGSFQRVGDRLLAPGMRLGAAELAVLAAAQCTQIPVYRRPKVALLSTGSELVAPDQPLKPGQIVDSNQVALAALVAQMGAEPILGGVVADNPQGLKAAIAQSVTTADVVISSGGVSVGDYDYVDAVLAELGAEVKIRAIAIKPGKPLTFATLTRPNTSRTVLYFGLPGNPVSALVTFWRFVQPALKKLSGLANHWQPQIVTARSQQPLTSDGRRESYLWGRMIWGSDGYEFTVAGGSHSSGNLINLAQTNALAILPVGQTQIAVGETVPVLVMGS